ncbi:MULTISPECIES: hypothetical protein [Pseudomonas]|uniref:hypothetical protein n=1 Tax=Pseudomonas TaxID=286 RepID=UPI001CFA4F0E|nr:MULTISPECIES: hypothetical protein [Pseudomonas]
MISMEMLGKIRRMYFRDKLALHQLTKRTGMNRPLRCSAFMSCAVMAKPQCKAPTKLLPG